MRLFKEENFQVIVEPELRLISEFKRIITRDRDRKKRGAFKELSYIYFVYDYKSPYFIYPETERKIRVRKDLELEPGWMEDSEMKDAIKKYISFLDTPAIKSLIAIREGLLSSANVIDALRIRIDQALAETGDEEEPTDIGSIVKSVTQLIELSEKLPKAIDTISDLEEKVKKEQSNESRIKGGGSKGIFEE
jgi:hypothetical protein